MGQIQTPRPVKLFVGMLAAEETFFALAEAELISKFGNIDAASELIPFNFTDYYTAEMGPNLKRKFISFAGLMNPRELVPAKLYTNELEDVLSERVGSERRAVNLDPGYVSLAKVVLASTKDYSHRIYLGDGIFAEVTLHYANKKFNPWPWTYPDYKTESYLRFFESTRTRYLEALRRAET